MNEYRGVPLSRKAYILYTALKLHFTTDYDYFKYNGKLNIKQENLFKKEKQYYWIKLSRHDDPFGLLLSNISRKPDIWIGDILSKEGQDVYLKHQYILQSLYYIFEQDIKKISLCDIKPHSNKFPNIISLYNKHEIHLETCIILIKILDLLIIWEDFYKNNLLWKPLCTKIIKYSPFIQFDKNKISKIIEKYWKLENV